MLNKKILHKIIVNYSPVWLQNLLVTAVNVNAYRIRRSGNYNKYRTEVRKIRSMTLLQKEEYVVKKQSEFLAYATKYSRWYSDYVDSPLEKFPILEKKSIIENLDELLTIKKSTGLKGSTGGTTGASMTVYYTHENMQERMAYLDDFRSLYGYQLGKKVAWFSGKNILGHRMVSNKVSRYDFVNKIRFYSTFHITPRTFDLYWSSFLEFQPEYFVGFPSSVYELCQIALSKGLKLDKPAKVFFPTAETVLDKHRRVISEVLGCTIIDQYASSEGAPFIFECSNHNYHIQETTGIFEINGIGYVDEIEEDAEGELLITSFTTYGVPLIRYRIGDRIKISSKENQCNCGDNGRLVEKIEGRETDFLWSKEKGRVNLGNLSNSTKGVAGIVCFQAIQNHKQKICFNVVSTEDFDDTNKALFCSQLRERLGSNIDIEILTIDNIPRESSGKFRIVKNSLQL